MWPGTGAAGAGREADAWAGCQQLIARRVDGVFFAPLERTPNRVAVNRRIADAFAAARVPVVLVDRSIEPFPQRGRHDLVGLDNRRAGAIVTSYLLDLECTRIAFVGEPDAASTVDARQSGYREALERRGLTATEDLVLRGDPSDSSLVATLMARQSPDAIVAATDRTAGLFMRTVMDLGYRVPSDVRIVGIDDAEYAGLLPVAADDAEAAVPGDRGRGDGGARRADCRAGSASARHPAARAAGGESVDVGRAASRQGPASPAGPSLRSGGAALRAALAGLKPRPTVPNRPAGRSAGPAGAKRRPCRRAARAYRDRETISKKLLMSSDAPPTSAPSTSGWAIRSFVLSGFTLPP